MSFLLDRRPSSLPPKMMVLRWQGLYLIPSSSHLLLLFTAFVESSLSAHQYQSPDRQSVLFSSSSVPPVTIAGTRIAMLLLLQIGSRTEAAFAAVATDGRVAVAVVVVIVS